jgi:RNA polymerase sigma-70 factor (ECF subfamily)
MHVRERDAELAAAMRAARRGDHAAYRRLLGEIARLVRPRIRRRLAGAPSDGEDVVQETLLAIHLKNGTWDDTRPILPWIYAIAEHKAVDALRRDRRAGRLVATSVTAEDLADTVAAPEPEHDLVGLDVERHLAALPAREREVVRALTLHGATVASLAARIGVGEGAIRVALHRGLKRLARLARVDPKEP